MINSTLEKQVKSIDDLLHRLIEEQDRKKLDTTSVNPSSTSCVVIFTRANAQASGASVGSTSMPNHFHSQTTIEGSAPTFGMPQQTMTSIFRQGHTQTAPSFSMSNFTSTPYTHGGNGRAYVHATGNYQALILP
jgi:hypothetical protein